MKKTLTIKIDNKGYQKGTVGWLLNTADHIKIGKMKSEEQGAWLQNEEGETICPLVIRNWYDDGKLAIISEWDPTAPGYYLTADFQMSDACFRRILEIAEEVKEKMSEIFEADSEKQLIIA